jgi:hypothetical protein
MALDPELEQKKEQEPQINTDETQIRNLSLSVFHLWLRNVFPTPVGFVGQAVPDSLRRTQKR